MLLKPYQIEGRKRLTKYQERKKLTELCEKQLYRCACCGMAMSRIPGAMRCATLDHIQPQPAGCFKDGSDYNLQALCWLCNYEKGSKR